MVYVKNDFSKRSLAEQFCQNDSDSIIDASWDEVSHRLKKSRNEYCIGVERTTLTRQLTNILTIAREWLSTNNTENSFPSGQVKNAEELISFLKPRLENLRIQLTSFDVGLNLMERAAESILEQAVQECLERISGISTAEEQAYNYYINLLKEPLVALDDISHPCIEKIDEEIEPYDFCRRAMGYMDAPDRTWDGVLTRIFTAVGTDRSGMDYGCASIIKHYLSLTGQEGLWKPEYNIESAVSDAIDKTSIKRNSVTLWEQDFSARLEMADGDNWFDADSNLRAHIQRIQQKHKEIYYYSENFGFYGRALNHMLEFLKTKAETLKPKYREEYDKLIIGHSDEDLEQPIFAQIREMIDKDRYGAAESFMQQVRNGNLTIGNGELSNGTLTDFLNRVNSELYRLAKLDTRKTLAAVYQEMHRKLINATLRSGENLVKSWPTGGQLFADKLRILFTELDQEVERVSGQNADFSVFFKDKGIVDDYPHPIAAFGSKMDQNGIDVALITGNRDSEGLLTEIDKTLRKNHSDRPLLFLVNSAVQVTDRRRLAKNVSRMTSNRPFLLMDRCLALHLADTPKTDRWKTLLRCSLPFRVINPYFESSSMPIPPDMFIGRRKEIQKAPTCSMAAASWVRLQSSDV